MLAYGLNDSSLTVQLDGSVAEYGVGEVNFHGANGIVDHLVNVPAFPQVDRAVDQAAIAQLRGNLAALQGTRPEDHDQRRGTAP